MIFNLVTLEFKIKLFSGSRLQQLLNEPIVGRVIAVGSLSIYAYITKFMAEAIEADSNFTPAALTMNVVPSGTYIVSSETVSNIFSSTIEATSTSAYTNQSYTYNQVSGSLLSDVYFQTFDESLSIMENLSSTLTPSLPWSSSGSTAISFSIAGYNNGVFPSFISVDSNSGVLTVSVPNVDVDTNYSFYINSMIQGVSNPIQKLIKVTVTNCLVQNCSKWINGNKQAWSVWYTGYTLSSSIWIIPSNQTTSQASETAKSMRSTMQIVFAITAGVSVISSLTSISSMSSVWLMVHQIQIFFLLLITGVFIPADVISVITGMKFALFPFEYFSLDKIGFYSFGVNSFNFGITNSNLELLKLSSDSTVFNIYPMMVLLYIAFIAHLFAYMLSTVLFKKEWKGKWYSIIKIIKIIANKIFKLMTYGYYIRTVLEMNQFLLISSINEISIFSTTSLLKIISLSVAFVIVSLCILLIILVSFLSLSSYEKTNSDNIWDNEHSKIGELFWGVKNGKYKIYTPTLLIRRFLFVAVLIFFASKSSTIVIWALWLLQIIYLIFLIILRPFEEVKWNMIDILNEIYFSILFGSLLYFDSEAKWKSIYENIYTSVILSNSICSVWIIIVDLIRKLILKMKNNSRNNRVNNITAPIDINHPTIIENQLKGQSISSRLESEISNNRIYNFKRQQEENKYSYKDSMPVIKFERKWKL